MTDIVEWLRHTAGHLINGTTEDGTVEAAKLCGAADIIEQYRADAAYDECTINFLKGEKRSEVRSEVVAWQKRRNDYARGEWIQVLPEHVDEAKSRGWQVRPLYAAPQPAIAAQAQQQPVAQKAIDFCLWLQGYFQGDLGRDELDGFEANQIRNQLNEKVFPPAMAVPSADRTGPYCKMSPCPLIEPSWGPCEKCAASPSASRGTEA